MILELNGTKVTIVDKTLGYQGDNLVNTIQVTVDKDSTWNYKLDMYKGKSKCFDSVLMTREDNVCTVQLTNEILSYGGRYIFQLRGYTDTQTYHSDIFESWVNASIEYQCDCKQAECECDCKLPTEFYQVEDNVTEINNHPPYPGDNGKWMIWDVDKHEYVESDIDVIGGGDYQTKANLTTSITQASTDEQYPSAKATYDFVQNNKDVMVVEFTVGETEDKYTSNYTTGDIVSAVQNGKYVYGLMTNKRMSDYEIFSLQYYESGSYYVEFTIINLINKRVDTRTLESASGSSTTTTWDLIFTEQEAEVYIEDIKAINYTLMAQALGENKICAIAKDTDLYYYSGMRSDSVGTNDLVFTRCEYSNFGIIYQIRVHTDNTITESFVFTESCSNKTNYISDSSTSDQYPSAKATYDYGQSIKSLGITSAAVGDIVKVKAVDASGKPTEWEATSLRMPLVFREILPEGTNAYIRTVDLNNKPFSLSRWELWVRIPVVKGAIPQTTVFYINNGTTYGGATHYFDDTSTPCYYYQLCDYIAQNGMSGRRQSDYSEYYGTIRNNAQSTFDKCTKIRIDTFKEIMIPAGTEVTLFGIE